MLAFASLYAKLWRLLSPLLFVLSPRCTIFASMDEKKRLEIEENIVKMLKTVYDPEIPVDIYIILDLCTVSWFATTVL